MNINGCHFSRENMETWSSQEFRNGREKGSGQGKAVGFLLSGIIGVFRILSNY